MFDNDFVVDLLKEKFGIMEEGFIQNFVLNISFLICNFVMVVSFNV